MSLSQARTQFEELGSMRTYFKSKLVSNSHSTQIVKNKTPRRILRHPGNTRTVDDKAVKSGSKNAWKLVGNILELLLHENVTGSAEQQCFHISCTVSHRAEIC